MSKITSKNGENVQVKMNALLADIAKLVVDYLEKVLPTISKSENWWKEAVVSILSFQQQRRVEQKGISSLGSLDLAALLRILDQNWYQISQNMDLASEARHYVKEMQTVRNRWAHAGTDGFSADDIYRDVDTLQRFASVVGANQDFIDTIKQFKRSLISDPMNGSPPTAEESFEGADVQREAEFNMGQIVCLKTNPLLRGAVVGITPAKPEHRYLVFLDGETRIFYASQLQAESKKQKDFKALPMAHFHAYLTALQIRHPGLSTLYSLNAARVDFIPYQFRPVLKFIRSDRPRLLIADGVGVGKTVEAGLVLRELQARRDMRSVLIICPRPLVTERKWEIEMKRFDERFMHLDGKSLRHCVNEMDLEGVWPEQFQKVIIPYSLFDEILLHGTGRGGKQKHKKGLLDLDPPPRFDLVIVDEAHHIRNPETYSHKAVRFFCDHAEAVVFLTATPIQIGTEDLFVLLNVLRPDLIIDTKSFEHMAGPNPWINRAVALARAQEAGWAANAKKALEKAAITAWGRAILRHNPEFNRILNQLSQASLAPDERVQLINDLESLHTFAGIINRTRRRDIGEFTIRKPETVVVEFTPEQKKLHDDLLTVQAEIFARLHGDINVKFMMTTIRRQAASCLYGLVPFLEDILNRHIDDLSWDEADNIQNAPFDSTVEAIEAQIRTILERARNLDPYDPKLEAIRNILKNKQELPNNKWGVKSAFDSCS
ncbi:MAG: Swt1 family HEPN domain-containing protein [Pseudomonadota bacterium]